MLHLKSYQTICFLLFTIINVFFCIRYTLRISIPIAIITTSIYLIISSLIWLIYKCNYSLSKNKIFIVLGLFIIICCVAIYFIPIESIRVDRVEMINIFWDNVLNGEYPYGTGGSINGNRPAGWPIFFILCYPFYLFKTYVLIPIFSILILLFIFFKKNPQTTGIITLMIVTSPAFYWEIICRSTIFFNATIFILWFISLANINKNVFRFYFSAVLGGLLLSTRSVLILPIFIYIIYALRCELSFYKSAKWCSCLFFTFLISNLPLLFYGIDSVSFVNPFIIQSSFLLPFNFTVIFAIISLIPAILCKSFTQTIFYCGISLFIMFFGYIIYNLITFGLEYCIYFGCDISYFLFSVPFFFYILLEDKKRIIS